MGTPQGPQKWYMKFLNHLLCASNDPDAPQKTWRKKCLDCLKPTPDQELTTTQDQGPQRETWGNRCTFFITTLGMSVGLGQVWRFPVLAYTHGGSVFLILYGFFIFTFGNVIFFFEVSNGQYASKNPLKVYDKVPLFIGVGWCMIIYAYFFCTYYSHMVAYSLFYLFHSFTAHLPWSYCPNDETDIRDSYSCMPYPKIRDPKLDGIVCGSEGFVYNLSQLCTVEKYFEGIKTNCCTAANVKEEECNTLFNRSDLCRRRDYPSEYYWNHCVTKTYRPDDPHWGYIGPMNWPLFGFSFLTWLIAYFTLYKGIKSLGVIMYIMVPLPYIVLIIMFGVVVPQPGATEGLKLFFTPDPGAFLNASVWRVATEQAFYSIGVAMGPLITFGSYSKFNSPSHIDGALICLCIFLTSFLCSLVVFAVLGFLAHKTGRKFQNVVEAGPGLVYVVYPEAIELLPGAPFFSFLFYLMLINLGLSSVTGIIETVPSAIYDIWPKTRNFKYLVNMGVLASAFLIGIPITARGGLAVYNAFDTYSAGMTLLPICAIEMLIIVYIYGLGRFCEDINFMLGFYPNRFYRWQWILGPFILTAVFLYGIATLSLPPSRLWSKLFGWFLFFCVMGWIPVGMIYTLVKYKKEDNLKNILKSPPDHGPKNPEQFEARKNFAVKRKIF